jgi:hypothetical protein
LQGKTQIPAVRQPERNHIAGTRACRDKLHGVLHMSLLTLDIGPGREVITTPMTFVASLGSAQGLNNAHRCKPLTGSGGEVTPLS